MFIYSKLISNACSFQPNIRKRRITKEVIQSFESSPLVAVYHYNDMNSQDWKKIRNKVAKHDVKLKVVPAKLTAKVTT